jgi:hypothetical protein
MTDKDYSDMGYRFTLDQVRPFCRPCHDACNGEACTGPLKVECTVTCHPEFAKLQTYVGDTGTFAGCADECPDGQYKDQTTKECMNCPADCDKCTALTVCTDCSVVNPPVYRQEAGGEGDVPETKTCQTTCSPGFFPV